MTHPIAGARKAHPSSSDVQLPSWVPAGTNVELYGAIRGMLMAGGVAVAPLFLGFVLFYLGLILSHDLASLGFWLAYRWAIYLDPYSLLYVRGGSGPYFAHPGLLCLFQWSAVSFLVGWETRRRPIDVQVSAAVVVTTFVMAMSDTWARDVGRLVLPDVL